jgi:2-hydroxychromene-2-carboxylate isomerase
MAKPTWKIFLDLQCPFSLTCWDQLPAIREKFGSEYEISVHLCSLLFHPQAFPAQCAASMIGGKKGPEAKLKFVDACFRNQSKYMNAATGDSRPSEVTAIFASIAKDAGIFDEELTEEMFLTKVHDWKECVYPAYSEHKEALAYGVYGTPKHVIKDSLVPDTESSWGPADWEQKLKTL